jgi:hypothetical protein
MLAYPCDPDTKMDRLICCSLQMTAAVRCTAILFDCSLLRVAQRSVVERPRITLSPSVCRRSRRHQVINTATSSIGMELC